LVFTPAVKALQTRYGSRRQYAALAESGPNTLGLGAQEAEFIRERDNFYLATVGATGWPYVQHRGGPKGFLKVIDARTMAFADFRGNKQFVSTGNVATDDRVALILVDYPRQTRLKVLGRAEILEGEKGAVWLERVRDPGFKAVIERVFVIRVEAFDWNCQQHITPRFTAQEIEEELAPVEERMRKLQEENERLRQDLARLAKAAKAEGEGSPERGTGAPGKARARSGKS
jgi:predicted pyridoxine 5'-phosphate oxidase superfamily flavin-nucleotide-binding protein